MVRDEISGPGKRSTRGFGDTLAEWRSLAPDSLQMWETDIRIGGCSVKGLADTFGTPLYVYDEATLRGAACRARRALEPLGARVSFAAKACASPAVLSVFREEGLGLDVVSAGEMTAGLKARFDPADMHLHGNLKSDADLSLAVELKVRAVVVDSLEEVMRLQNMCAASGASASVMLRLALPIDAETHPHLQTSGRRSKFGIAIRRELPSALSMIASDKRLNFIGLHAHLGSQIDNASVYVRAITYLDSIGAQCSSKGLSVQEIGLGGGWAVPYHSCDHSLEPEHVAAALAPCLSTGRRWLLSFEPGRWLAARAGVAIYRVGVVKRRSGVDIAAVDGGMGDNPRPALYASRYAAFSVNRPQAATVKSYDLVGRYCESGDLLARDVRMPELRSGDLVCVPVSGAYHLSMASAYNLIPPPAAVMVLDGHARFVTRRATIDDLLSREVPPDP